MTGSPADSVQPIGFRLLTIPKLTNVAKYKLGGVGPMHNLPETLCHWQRFILQKIFCEIVSLLLVSVL
jgi:hypothetical protein